MWEGIKKRDGENEAEFENKGLFPVSLAASLSSREIRNQNSKNRELYCQGHVYRAGVGDVGPSPQGLRMRKRLIHST